MFTRSKGGHHEKLDHDNHKYYDKHDKHECYDKHVFFRRPSWLNQVAE